MKASNIDHLGFSFNGFGSPIQLGSNKLYPESAHGAQVSGRCFAGVPVPAVSL